MRMFHSPSNTILTIAYSLTFCPIIVALIHSEYDRENNEMKYLMNRVDECA